jgi:hypothetical protein
LNLGARRTALNNELKKVKAADKARHLITASETQLNLAHDLALVQARIDRAKESAHIKRENLRRIHFLCARTPAVPPLFYTAKTCPENLQTDGRKWRIKLGNKSLDPGRIKMIGAGAVVGEVPRGLKIGIPKAPENTTYIGAFLQLLPFAVIISLLGFMEAIAIAKSMAAKTGQKLDPNQELIGQGLANIIGSFGHSYAVSGSFSRSAVNLQANAVTGVSSVVTSLMVAITLLF